MSLLESVTRRAIINGVTHGTIASLRSSSDFSDMQELIMLTTSPDLKDIKQTSYLTSSAANRQDQKQQAKGETRVLYAHASQHKS